MIRISPSTVLATLALIALGSCDPCDTCNEGNGNRLRAVATAADTAPEPALDVLAAAR